MLEEPLLFEIGSDGQTGVDFADVRHSNRARQPRAQPADRPARLSEPETVRHYTRLSRQNYAIDLGLFPLGIVHDEAQSAPQREGRADAGLRRRPSAAAAGDGSGRASGDRRACSLAARPHRHARHRDEPQGRRTWRALRPPVHPRGARSARRQARSRPGPGERARHQPGDRGLRRLSRSRTFRRTRRVGSISTP